MENNIKQTTFDYIDSYCERINFNEEPVNIITNFAFIVAGVLLLNTLFKIKEIKLKNFDILLLGAIIIAIGLGSAAYHFQPNNITLNLDVMPIAVFIHLCLLSILIRVFKLSWWLAIPLFMAFIGAGVGAEIYLDRDILNGTIMYIPTYITLLLIVVCLKAKAHPMFKYTAITAIIWTFSLIFRTIDASTCGYSFGIGTHSLWHMLNAIVLYRLVMLLICELREG
jgi:hypothetical protein